VHSIRPAHRKEGHDIWMTRKKQRAKKVRQEETTTDKQLSLSLLPLDGQKELELGGELLFGVQPIGEVDSPNSAVRVDLDTQGFNVVSAVCSSREVGEIELNLVPTLVQAHRHCANERLDSGR